MKRLTVTILTTFRPSAGEQAALADLIRTIFRPKLGDAPVEITGLALGTASATTTVLLPSTDKHHRGQIVCDVISRFEETMSEWGDVTGVSSAVWED